MTTFEEIAESILKGLEQNKKEMEEKNLLTEKTTFEDITQYAGQHISLTEKKN